jgi:Type III flagellar switch regulator (C-ring) FliN C-term
MNARPYKVFGAAERAFIEEHVGAAIKTWRAAWLPAGASVRTECAPAGGAARRFPAAQAGWLTFAAADASWAMAAERGAIGALAGVLCGVGDGKTRPGYAGDSEIANEAARRALRELAAALLAVPLEAVAAKEEQSGPDAHAWDKGSPAIALWLTLGDTTLRFVSSPVWALRLLKARLPRPAAALRLENRRNAVAGRKVALEVVAGWVELDLRALRGLSPGNVIALTTRIDTPLNVVAAGRSVPMFRGRLGTAQGRRAIALVGAR